MNVNVNVIQDQNGPSLLLLLLNGVIRLHAKSDYHTSSLFVRR